MVENETFTYSMKKAKSDQSNIMDHSLITTERTQKLELLIHLISNLPQPLVICGPDGVGKTTLLQALHERKMAAWCYCLVPGSMDLSFETIQEQLNLAMRPASPKSANQHQNFDQYQSKNKKIVLLIDNAGALVPGLITTIIQYAWANPVLRVVLALTHDELHVKSSTDYLIDDCHFVEIPPLTEKQCGDFLQQLAGKPWTRLPLNAISESMIHEVYRHTHGIPGKIIAEIPRLARHNKKAKPLSILIVAVAGLVSIALGVQWLSNSKNRITTIVAPSAIDTKAVVTPATQTVDTAIPLNKQNDYPVTASENILNQYVAGTAINMTAPSASIVAEHKLDPPANENANQQEIKDKELPASAGQVPGGPLTPDAGDPGTPADSAGIASDHELSMTDAQADGIEWLKTQPAGNFTLQVMVLSKEQSVKDFQKKYSSLAPNLRYTRLHNKGKEKFLLLYGSFESSALAYKAKQSLPPEFSHSLVKKMSAIKK